MFFVLWSLKIGADDHILQHVHLNLSWFSSFHRFRCGSIRWQQLTCRIQIWMRFPTTWVLQGKPWVKPWSEVVGHLGWNLSMKVGPPRGWLFCWQNLRKIGGNMLKYVEISSSPCKNSPWKNGNILNGDDEVFNNWSRSSSSARAPISSLAQGSYFLSRSFTCFDDLRVIVFLMSVAKVEVVSAMTGDSMVVEIEELQMPR